ncbi:MAG: hypothetical protein ACRDIU_04440 [Actinomycetota bacterium]
MITRTDAKTMRRATSTTPPAGCRLRFPRSAGAFWFQYERDGVGATLRSYLNAGQPLAMSNSKGTFYFHRDGLGSVVNLTDSAAKAQWSYGYEPFGGASFVTKNNSQAPDNPLRYTVNVRTWTGLCRP